MHPEAYSWVRRFAPPDARRVLDIGGRNINGTTRALFPGAEVYRAIDILPGDGVDIVADAATWTPDGEYDVVVCTEVFEHAARWPDIVTTAFKALRPGGLFLATMAGPGRPVHSGVDGLWQLHPGEHYANVPPAMLSHVLTDAGFTEIRVDQQPQPADVRCIARRPWEPDELDPDAEEKRAA